MTKLLAIAALVLCAFALTAGVGEVVLRVLLPQNLVLIRSDVWVPHERYSWTNAPDLDVGLSAGEQPIRLVTDSDGNRVGGQERAVPELKILALGDSFLQAVEVDYEDTFAARLEERLTRELGRAVAVVNSGVSGWSPNQYRLKMEDAVSSGAYDLVVVFLYLGNDVVGRSVRAMEPRAPTVRHAFRMPAALNSAEVIRAWLYPINDFLEERSHLFTFVKDRTQLLRMRFGLTAVRAPVVLDRTLVKAVNWDVTTGILDEMASLARSHGIGFAVVMLSSIYEVDSEYVEQMSVSMGIDPRRYDLDQASREMGRRLARGSVPVIDTLAALREAHAGGGPRLFDRVTIHLSPSGHRAVADAAAEPLRDLLEKR